MKISFLKFVDFYIMKFALLDQSKSSFSLDYYFCLRFLQAVTQDTLNAGPAGLELAEDCLERPVLLPLAKLS